MRSASGTRGRPVCPPPTSRGPPEAMSAPARERPGGELGPAFAAVRVRLGLVLLLFVLAGVGWWWTAGRMHGMDGGPWTGLGALGWFVGVWAAMMAAVRVPPVAPTVARYSSMTKGRSPLAPVVFACGYLVAWAAVGLAVFAVADAA